MTPVVVVGDVATDVVVRLRGALARGSDTPARVTTTAGGSAANVAWWLARQGSPVTLVARVGDDPPGRQRVHELESAGVTVHAARDRERPTGTVVVLVDRDGERSMLPDRGANLALAPTDVAGAVTGSALAGGHLHVSGYTLLADGPRPAALAAIAAARRAGATVSVDPSSTAPLAAAGAERFLAWTAGADLVLPNLAEARLLSGRRDPVACATGLASTYGAAAVTLGAGGAVWAVGDRAWRRPAEHATVTDTTGAGDAFTAGVLGAWLAGAGPEAALAAGVSLAAEAVAVEGARPS